MENNHENTLEAIRIFLEKENFAYSAEMNYGVGFLSVIRTVDRTYTFVMRVDPTVKKLIMELYPEIHCENVYKGQTSSYISQVNDQFKDGNFRITSNGSVFTTSTLSFNEHPIEAYDVKAELNLLMNQCDTFEKIIDKLAHGQLLNPGEYDAEEVVRKRSDGRMPPNDIIIDDIFPDFDGDDGDDVSGE